jgi:prephenate dehydrogenase
MKFAGRGFIDTSRLASGPADVWTDILLTNSYNITPGIDRLIRQLTLMKKAVAARDAKAIEKLLERARTKREKLIEYKLRRRELL